VLRQTFELRIISQVPERRVHEEDDALGNQSVDPNTLEANVTQIWQ
jgi:hypothetical protein